MGTWIYPDGTLKKMIPRIPNPIILKYPEQGGIWESIRLETCQQVIRLRERNLIFTMFFAGTVFILCIYHLWIYLFRRKEKAALWFGILCFIVLVRTLQVNERILFWIFPDFNLSIAYRLEYITIFSLIPLFFTLYYYSLFEINHPKIMLKIIFAVSILEFFMILFSPTLIHTSIVTVFQIILYLIFIYFFILTFNQMASKKKGARLLLFFGLIILLCGLNDILYLNLVINTAQVSHFAFFVFLVRRPTSSLTSSQAPINNTKTYRPTWSRKWSNAQVNWKKKRRSPIIYCSTSYLGRWQKS